jgi:DNA (cytosine-5)-methyltransferase 1
MRFPYNWTLADAKFTKDKGKVFSCFACGGGSTMGYKLAGFDVIGANDIDKKMAEVYKLNHDPKYYFLESITTLAKRKDLPKELYNLDILDGSPPCSSFSMAGNREKDWGKEKVFREGQELQILDTLFFDFIDLAKELQPKVVVAENVKGLLLGNAKEYVRKIYTAFDEAGYYCQHWLLDASKMGVPQRRERVFFIAFRKDLAKPFLVQKDMFTEIPKLELSFNEPQINFKDFADYSGQNITEHAKKAWDARIFGDESIADSKARVPGMNVSDFNSKYIYDNEVCSTLTSKSKWCLLFEKPIRLSVSEIIKIGTFPNDYNFNTDPYYLIGMSVPPVMTAQIVTEIYNQWLKHL